MEYRNVGNTGLKISEISLGAWLTYGGSVEKEEAKKCITAALENGVNFIDIADVYARGEAEKVVGEILAEETIVRKDVVISSKVFWPMGEGPNDRGLSRKHIMESHEASLDRLNLDYLDIYFCHRYDRYTPLDEVILTIDDLVRSGLVTYWGTSVWPAIQLERATWMAKELKAHPPKVEQPRYHMLDRFIELEVMETCARNGIGIVVWSPLGQGLLTGKYNDGIPAGSRGATSQWLSRELTEENLTKVRKLTGLATELGMSTGQLALAWILRRPEISCCITGATKEDHVLDNVKAAGRELSNDTLEQIEKILDNKPESHPIYRPPW